ncbi:MAG: hypothetical protein M3O30_08850 [Planctomycetota bacterium]|nr:hypothetical protein [Planctomycetota bacterium]
MKTRFAALFVAIGLGVSQLSNAAVTTHNPGALAHGFGITLTFNNLDQVYPLTSTVYSGDVNIVDPNQTTIEVLRFIPENTDATLSDSAIVFTSDQLPSPSLANQITISANVETSLTEYDACHCDKYFIPVSFNPSMPVVPLPASSMMGGLGLAVVVLAGWLRSRRLSVA